MRLALPLAAFAIPLIACWANGASPAMARMLIGAGIVLYILGSVLRTFFARRGVSPAPGWVAMLGLIGTGLAPAGIAVLLFISLGLIPRV